jgi:hypothetical protein
MAATKQEQVETWIIKIRSNPTVLNSLHPDIAQFWLKQASINETTIAKTTAMRISHKGLGISIGITEDSNINQVIDFAFRLQMMRSAGTISQDFWRIGAESIQQWLSDNDMDWNSLLSSMKGSVA